jgi:tripartite-type tricarboxylate transporter receptor subunit TctC
MQRYIGPGFVALSLLVSATAPAQQYPTKPIRMIVPFPPGGTADVAARVMSNPLAQALGQTIVIDNRPGADGVIAAETTIRAQPDGHTLFWTSNSAMSAVPALRKKPPYDPVTQFTPICSLGRFVFFLYVHPSLPVRSVKELIEYARANPGKVNYGTGNTTSIVATAQFRLLTKLDINHVPYKGDAPTTNDLVGGRLQMAFMSTVPALAQAREGKLRMIATLLRERSALAPDIPTMTELGFPGVSATPWAGLVGPANMPQPIVQRLARELNQIVTRQDITEQLGKLGFVTLGSSPEEFAGFVRAQLDAWRKAVREANIPQD